VTEERAKRKLAAIFSADVKGYSRLMADDEEATVRTITAYREVMTGLIKEHRGRVADAKGDNVLAEFSSVVDANRCNASLNLPPITEGLRSSLPLLLTFGITIDTLMYVFLF
jgi:class 3 adenylate cyclase